MKWKDEKQKDKCKQMKTIEGPSPLVSQSQELLSVVGSCDHFVSHLRTCQYIRLSLLEI